ncbi:MAG: GNAT family N-acetyltransferase [Flavobacterium sp.]|uniref:GNAT family N-acetyltransferase n=1 Tax=Flavobacterium sp. TaxID=239 RepID=UPI0022BB84D9|nr:GNAT family N-acetyltransferase [Flavobacterium sp.]MCZ8198626.1 GNAT family N-acetyltransferase [Flavobacterium sp.]
MKNYIIRQYKKEDKAIWNTFISNAKNATFLFNRNFMEYHSDRFEDFSLLIFDESEKLVAVLPANRVEEIVYSHQGLSYGGLVLQSKIKLNEVIYIVQNLLSFLEENSIKKLHLKLLPTIYFKKPSQEIDYVLFLVNAKLVRRDVLSVIDLKQQSEYSDSRKRAIKKGVSNNITVKEDNNFELFWNEILIPNLALRHNAKPVHSVEEIRLLKSNFPENIRHFNVYFGEKLIAGTTVFVTDNVAHSQYMSADESRKEFGSLDFLHDYLIRNVFQDMHYFDFGISNENQGMNVNSGLIYWKEGFDASSVAHDFYEVDTKNHNLLNTVLI